jgi:UDP-N-acetylmuramoyl-tripeptide--D-alanyl-D-alanine ligase
MIPLPLETVAELCPGDLRTAPGAHEVTGVKIDSRAVEPGDLFVAVGAGEAFLGGALAQGAAATLVPQDPHAALAALGRAVRDRAPARVVGITGSMGKTTTKDILAAICRAERRTVAAERSFNAELGVPLTLCRLEHDTEVCVVELAMRGFGQIAALCEIARPEIGVVTNIGPVHLEKVETLAGVTRAKAELVDALPAGGTAIVPADFPVDRSDLEVVRLGEDVRVESFDPPFLVTSIGTVEVDFTARHLATGALAALAAARALGVQLPPRLEVVFAEWRNQELPLPDGGLLINDSWNANPVSMRAALEHLVDRAGGRRTVAVLGSMAELGDYSDEGHREVASAIGEAGIEVVVAVGAEARPYGGLAAADAEEAIAIVETLLRPGDCVLVKGSRALRLERVADALVSLRA